MNYNWNYFQQFVVARILNNEDGDDFVRVWKRHLWCKKNISVMEENEVITCRHAYKTNRCIGFHDTNIIVLFVVRYLWHKWGLLLHVIYCSSSARNNGGTVPVYRESGSELHRFVFKASFLISFSESGHKIRAYNFWNNKGHTLAG